MAKIPPRRKVTEKTPTAHQLWKVKPEMEKDFIDFCNESAALHGHKGASLKEWTSVITKLNAKYDQHFDQKTLKNKWDSLRQGYVVWRKLITKTGHGRNADGTFNWPPEVWKAAIEQDSRCAKFQYEPLKYHQELEMLFEGTFAAGDSRENCGEDVVTESSVDVDVDVDADADVYADVFENETHFDLESDAYLSTARDDSPGFVASRDARDARDASPMSVPNSGKASGSSLGSEKRKRSSGELDAITTMLQSHLASSQSNVEMVRKRFEREEEHARIEFERKEEEVKKAKAYSLEQCCKIMAAMKELPEKVVLSGGSIVYKDFNGRTSIEGSTHAVRYAKKKILKILVYKGFGDNGSRRKSTPRRAAEAGIDFKLLNEVLGHFNYMGVNLCEVPL